MSDARPAIRLEITITGGTTELVDLLHQLLDVLSPTIEGVAAPTTPAPEPVIEPAPEPAPTVTAKPKREYSPETLEKLRANAARARAAKFQPRLVEPLTGGDGSVVNTAAGRAFCWDPVEADFQQVRNWAVQRGLLFETWDDDLPRVNRKREQLGLPVFKRKFR